MTAIKEVLTPQTVGGLIPEAVGTVPPAKYFNGLIYGDPGAGKTWLAGSASEVPDFGKILHIDAEGGSVTLRRRFPNVERIRPTTWKEIEEIEEDLFQNDCYDFGTVILDNGTEAQNRCKRLVAANALAKSKADPDTDPHVFGQPQWGVLYDRFMTTTRNFIDLPCNFICTAWAMEVSDNHGKKRWRPSLQGSAKQDWPGLEWRIVGYLHTETDQKGEKVRVFSTEDTKDWLAKARDTDLPPDLYNPTMAEIWKYIPTGESE